MSFFLRLADREIRSCHDQPIDSLTLKVALFENTEQSHRILRSVYQ